RVDGRDPVLKLEREEIPRERQDQCLVGCGAPGRYGRGPQEALPFGRELVAYAERSHQTLCTARLHEVVQFRLELACGLLSEKIAAFARGVSHVQDDVGNRVVVERLELRRQLDPPRADCALSLEGQVALVPEVRLEETAVVLALAGD